MKITDVRLIPISVPRLGARAWRNAYGGVGKRDETYVFVDTDDGLTGLGVAYQTAHGADATAAIVEHILKPAVLGEDPEAIGHLWDKMFFSTLQLGSAGLGAIAGIDMALWDILGRATGRSIATLLGGAGAHKVPAYVGCQTLGLQETDTLVAEARDYVEAGFRALKIRGGAGIAQDVAAVAAIREAFGSRIDIMIDANSAYSWPEAVRLSDALAELDTFWLEDPFDFTVKYHHAEMGRLRSRGRTPLASGGNLYTRFECRSLIEAGGVDFLTPDVIKCGGLSEAVKIGHLASAFGMVVAPHTVVGLCQVASIHFAAAVPQHVLGYVEWDPSSPNPLRDNVLTTPIRVEDGFLNVPEGAGLGTDVNVDLLKEYPSIRADSSITQPRVRRWSIQPS